MVGGTNDGADATAPTVQAQMAMSGEQLTEILRGMQSSMQESMQLMMTNILNNRDAATASVAATAAANAQAAATATASEQGKPEKKEFHQRFDPKQFQRLDKFSSGDAAWKLWSFDFKVIAEALNPSLTKWFEVSERPDATEEALKREYGKPDVDSKDIEAKAKELFGLLCILTE